LFQSEINGLPKFKNSLQKQIEVDPVQQFFHFFGGVVCVGTAAKQRRDAPFENV
jgi:hypothetical protein